jgi:hypothetical protein
LIRYANHSARGVAPLAKLAWRPRQRPSRGLEPSVTRRNALERRADRGMRAYVTGSDDAQTSAMRARYGLTPRRVASSGLATHERREGLCARTACRRRSLGCGSDEGRRHLRCSAGAAATQVATLMAAGGAMVPVVSTRTREANSTRTDSRAAPATLRLHRTYRSCVKRRTATSLRTLSRPRPRQQDNVAWLLLKNQPLTSSMNTWPPLSGCLLTEKRLSI